MINYESIGKRIRKNRDRLGMTQETLAERVNVSIPHISRMENGSAKPSLQTLVDICNVLGITIDELMCDSLPAVQRENIGLLTEVLAGCSKDELDMITDVVSAILQNLRK